MSNEQIQERHQVDTASRVREEFARTVPEAAPGDPAGASLDMDADMADSYGLSSLDKVLFLTAICDTCHVSLATFTELDLAEMRSLGDVVAALQVRS
ncbi:MAG: acyl carrier protein [Frankiaceae bacterium]|nr:acyl carrier protein [Frankiaceae bacterium]